MLRSSFLRGVSALAATPAATVTASPAPPVLGAEDLIAPASMRADLNATLATLVEVGAAPFRTSSQRDFVRRANSLHESLSTSRPLRSFYLELAALFASLNDGHCGISPSFYVAEYDRGARLVLPLETSVEDDGVSVVRDVGSGSIPPGSRIERVEDIGAEALRRGAMSLQGGQTEALRRSSARVGRFLYLELGARPSYMVTYRPPEGGALVTTPVGLLTKAETSLAFGAGAENDSRPYRYRALRRNVGLIHYRSCTDPQKMAAFCAETFERIRRDGVRALIIDVRDNSGGDSRVSDVLLPFLTARPYAQFGATEKRISDRLKREYGREKFTAIYGPDGWAAANGSLLRYPGGGLTAPGPQPHRFAGPIYVLIGTTTFSSAMSFASAIRDFRIATIVGEETGEPVVSTGEVYRATSPFSGFVGYFTTKLFFGPKPHPDGQGVVPDVSVPTTLADRIAGRDPVMDKTLALIG